MRIYRKNQSTMELCFALLLVLFTLFLLYRRRSKSREKYLNDRLPYLRQTRIRLPLIEGFITLWRARNYGVKILDKIPKDLGKTYKCHLLLFNAVVTSDVKIVRKLLSSTALTHLNKPEAMYRYMFSEFLNEGLIVAHSSIWEPPRKAVSPAFSYRAFPTYLEFMNEASLEMIKSACKLTELKNEGIIGNPEMKKFISLAAVQTITNILMGSNHFDVPQSELAKFHESFHRLKEIHLNRFLRPELFITFIWKLHPKSKAFSKAVAECRQFVHMIIEMYRKNNATRDQQERAKDNDDQNCGIKTTKCLIEHMLTSEMTNQEINDQVSTFMTVGHETTVVAVDFLLFHLAKHPEYQRLCREELDGVFDFLDESGKLSMENLSELKFLERCVLESMRLTPTVPGFTRQLEEDLEIETGCVLKAGTIVLVNAWSTHRDPEFYPDPEKFDPDRFLPGNVKLRPYHSYIPFSLGPRNCIAWKLAILETKVIAAYILRNFEMTTTDSIEDINLLYEVTLKPERMYNIQFKRRQLN